MNCAFDKEKLTGYYDGELGAAEKAEVERHIASCSECLRDLGELKSAALLVKELPRLRAPASVAQGVSREIQAEGKVHVFANFRRSAMWISAAAAGLFVVMNALYFTSMKREAPMASRPALSAPMARSVPSEKAASDPDPSAVPSDRRPALDEGLRQDAARRELEDRKSPVQVEEQKKQAGAVDALKKADAGNEMPREKTAAPVPAPKPEAPAPAPVLAATPAPPGAPKPSAAPATPTTKGEAGKPFAADKEKDLQKVEPAFAPKVDPTAKARSGALEAPAELAPIHCTLSAVQLPKVRTRMEETLKKLGVALPVPPPVIKGPRRDPDTVFTIELSDSQLAALREELEKPGDARLMQSNPVEPVLPQFRSGGIFGGGKKDVASAGAPAAKAKSESKESEEAAAMPEPRRKVTLHLIEVKTLPADADAPKK